MNSEVYYQPNVMALKIKPLLSRPTRIAPHLPSNQNSPLQHQASRMSTGGGLRSLSKERDMKKLTKLRQSPSDHNQRSSRQMLESLVTLEEHYENMKTKSSQRNSLKRSMHLRGVPHTCITLNPKPSQISSSFSSASLTSSICNDSRVKRSEKGHLRVVSIGGRCSLNKTRHKKKGISISLLQGKIQK